jgi:hypothetical protein
MQTIKELMKVLYENFPSKSEVHINEIEKAVNGFNYGLGAYHLNWAKEIADKNGYVAIKYNPHYNGGYIEDNGYL